MDSYMDNQPHVLHVDFTWSNFKAIITEDAQTIPLYTVSFGLLHAPHMTFKSAANGTTIGTGTLHAIDISPDYELHGVKGSIKAQKRFKTVYTYQSHTYSEDGSPITMTWTSNSGFKIWDFVCVNEKQIAVAKFSANMWTLKKVGQIELLGPKADDPAARDEIVVVGITLFYCMWLRVNNVFNLAGSLFSRPGRDKDKTSTTNTGKAT
ncbi:hypothetical protein BGW36DRAFT_379689 [Talaromyces proteolyticus]|uniref:Uncharacterized protein n=1 Tax=Talaromyces proteolyticus TaxID=1131652 RepID=A0AAD4PWJ0_9EURO|nr:uncharacterized protein BGW36DRAFT_379689 [Talaromyces proteolyticus]KAH8697920.1 hypothetical protein BGW36DRAFT_379689 [Talaromyces proteolyticus]